MPRSLHVVVALGALAATTTPAPGRASPIDDLEGDVLLGALDADDLANERAWLDPLGARRGSLGFTLRGAVARWLTTTGPSLRWEIELVVQLPLDRLLAASDTVSTWTGDQRDPAMLGMGAAMKTKNARRWGTLAALPGALALGGAASAKGKPAAPTATSTTASTVGALSASIAPSSSGVPSTKASASAIAPKIVTTNAPIVAGAVIGAPSLVSPATLRALVNAAWRVAGLDRDEALSDLASRAKASALAPELRLRAHRTLAYGARVLSAETLADRTTLSDGTETSLEARLTWRLDRLIFADEEIAIERVKLDRAELKQRVASRVVELTIAWQRARRASENPDLLPQEREEAALMALEALLALDAYTGGAAGELLRP